MPNRNLVFDIGVNEGQDSGLYLDKGFSVIGIEANPLLIDSLRTKFSGQIVSGQYIILSSGIWSEQKTMTFYVNLDNNHWSSFNKDYGARNGSRYREVQVDCINVNLLIERFGVPYFMKVDVEGADHLILSDLQKAPYLPGFLSVEEYGVQALVDLRLLGYSGFKIVAQRDKSGQVPPNPPLEGLYVDRKFDGLDSGLFGLELPGDWMSFEAARSHFTTYVRDESYRYVGPEHEWYDIHARR